MKKLLIALGAAVAVSTVFARVTTQQGFESDYASDFVAYGEGDESAVAEYGTTPAAAAYPFSDFGSKYLDIDTGDATLWCTNAGDATYFDMYMQFNPCSSAPELENDTKLAVYLDASSNLYVMAGSGSTAVTNLNPGTWARLTVAGGDSFKVYLDGVLLGTYPSRTGDASVKTVGFKGSGALDNYVARTTDPLYVGEYAASIGTGNGSEKFATCAEALTEALKYGGSITRNLLGASAQDGSAAAPFQISDVDTLKAFQAAAAEGYGLDKCYVQTADIALNDAWPGIGIQNGKDLATGSDTKKAEYEAGAFKGTYDGGNHTISGFQMVGVAGNPASTTEGLDYCGFFNSTYGATIKNLKIQYAGSLFAVDTTASTMESGATFVGVAKNSTLQNLTSIAGTVSCSKGFGGIVGYTTDGTIVDSCTNNLNMTSLANNKCGGIAMITQGGSAVTISNCQNNGTQTTGSSNQEYGAIVGYVGLNTTIADCETTVGRFLKHQNNTVTLQGVNKGDATVASYHGAATPGLNFAMVDGNVATFVADNALVVGNTYKVMASGATATYEFAAAGAIAFDESLFTPTYNITASSDMLDVVDAKDGDVNTYTATAAPVVATITKDNVTTSYRTLQAAIEDAVSGDTVNLVGAATGEVNIPEGITVQLVTGCAIADVTSLSGKGVLSVPSGTLVPLVQTNHAASLLRDAEKWAGTLFIKDATMTGPDGLAYYGNANSTVRFENVWLNNYSSSHAIGTLELVGAGVYIQATSGNMTLPCALVGDGSISLRDASDTQRTVLFSGDVSAFAGNVTVATDTKSRIVFGTNASTQGNNNCIVVDSGASVTVAEGKTWTAPNGYVIKGTATVSGTLAAGSEKVYGAGCVIYTSATAAAASAPIAGTWTGTCVVGWAPTGAFNPNTYGNANSTVVLSNDLAASAYFGPGSATTLTINPTVRIAADVEIKNGYSKADDTCLVTFTKLTGDHKFTTSAGTGGTEANPTTRRYAITTLDNFTGSLKVKAGSELRIAAVNVADGTDLTGCIIPAECDAKTTVQGSNADGVITGDLALKVAGVDSGKVLEYKADGADGAGLYVKASAPVTPTIDPATDDTLSAVVTAADADAAIAAVEVAAPTGVAAAAYKANFDFTATSNGDGTYTVTLTGIKDEVKETVEESAMDVLDGKLGAKVQVPAGLSYKVTTYTELGGTAVTTESGTSDGNGVSASKPGTTQGFIKVEMATKAFN